MSVWSVIRVPVAPFRPWALALLLCLASAGAEAEQGLDVAEWINRPGVRAVAVEFYATWCKPCMEAMPRWKELRRRYGGQGLRVIVVNTKDDENGCAPPKKWQPDHFVCDPNGVLAQRFGVGDRLPSALLWSWQGNLIMSSGHITEVEAAVEQTLRDTPSVEIEPGRRVDPATVALVKELLTDTGKIDVTASEEERKALAALRRQVAAHEGSYCESGREVANSLLKLNVNDAADGQTIAASLFDAKTQCQTQAASARWDPSRPRDSVRDLVANLMAKLRRPNVQYPSSVATTESGAALGERAGTLSITSDVPDADVFVDGNPTGDKAGARAVQLDLPPGRHQVKVSKTGYLEHVETVQLAAARRVEVAARLVAEAQAVEAFKGGKTTVLAVSTRPEGAVVLLDGRPIGRSNGTFDVPPGPHVLRTRLDWYLDSEQQVVLEEGETRGIVVVLKPTFGSVEVTSATPANLYIGDREIGRAGPREPVKVARVVEGRHKLEAYAPGFFDLGQTIDVKAGERLVVALPPMRPSLGAFTIESAPPGAICEIDGVEKGRTPLTVDRLPQGAHEVRLTLPRHQALVRSEPAKAGETSLLKYVLEPTFTRLEVRSEPSRAKVWLDGKVEGETPLALDVDEGEHEVRIAADDRSHTAWSGRITAVRKRPISLERKLEPRYGRLVVTTQPPGAAITLDDQPLGASPFARDKVLGGPHKLSLRLDGYRPETLTADVVANRENRVDRALLRLLPREEAELRLREWDDANAMPVLWSRVALGSAVAGGLLAVVGALRWHGVSGERDALREAYRQASTDADARFAQLEAAARSEVAWGATTIGAAVLTAGLGALSAYLFATIPPRPEFAMEQP